MASKEVKLRPFSFSKSSFILKVPTTKLNARKQIRAFMPNLVHSLDAASLALVAEYYFNSVDIKNFYAIHDCFAVTCNNIPNLL
jgi:DNA-directed RNA polymerase